MVAEAQRKDGVDDGGGGGPAASVHIFLPNLAEGGAQAVMIRLANFCVERGHPTTLIVSAAEGPHKRKIDPRVAVISFNAHNMVHSTLKLTMFLVRRKPPTLLSAITFANLPAILAKRFARSPTKVVISARHAYSRWLADRRPSRRLLYGILVPWLYRRADALIAVSNGVADDLSRTIRCPREAIEVIYNPSVDGTSIGPLPPQSVHRWFADGSSPVLVAAGRLDPQKDFPTLLRAFAQLRAERPIRLIILGEGPQRPQLEALAKSLGVSDDVDMPGYADDPLPYFRAAAAFVLSSIYEGFPNVLVEALACGVPVVSTDCESGPKEILQDGKIGRLVPLRDPDRLAEAIGATLAEPGCRQSRLDRAADFTMQRTGEAYLETLCNVTAGGGRR